MPELAVSLRNARTDEERFLESVFFSTRQALLEALPPQHREAMLRMQYEAQLHQYKAMYPEARHQIILSGMLPAGYLLYADDAVGHIVDVALLPQYRSRGIGSTVIRSLQSKGKPIRLTVATDNPAVRLYQRLGFIETGRDSMNIRMEWTPAGSNR